VYNISQLDANVHFRQTYHLGLQDELKEDVECNKDWNVEICGQEVCWGPFAWEEDAKSCRT
jgi:hypothetical protein